MHEQPASHRFFALLHKAVFATDRHANTLLSKEDSYFSDFLILSALQSCEDPSQQNIALYLNLTPAAVSRRIDALVKRGLTKRTEDPNSRRTNRIALTSKGKAEVSRIQKILEKGFKNQIASLSAKEIHSTCTVLEILLHSFNKKAI